MDAWRDRVYQGDCLDVIDAYGHEIQDKVKLIYIDPPFLSQTEYTIQKRSKGGRAKAGALTEKVTYADKWAGGLDEYLEFLRPRLLAMKPLLSEDGSIWVHLDWHGSHYVKVMLDEIFGYANFVNEIVWKRTNSPKAQSKGFGAQHDVILVYARNTSKFSLNQILRDHDERSLKPYSYSDKLGRFRLIEIEAQGIQRTENRRQFEWRGRTAPYLYKKETLDQWWNSGLIYESKNGRYTKKQYLSDIAGIPVSDLWLDIPPIQGASKEFTGFLTQKPVALVRRILEAGTAPGDLVCDFFAGSGTTAVAAVELQRRWLICDVSQESIGVIERRLNGIKFQKVKV